MIDHNDGDDSPGETPHDTSFDPASDSVSEELLTTLITINDADPTDLEALTDSVDPDALDTLFEARPNNTRSDSDISVGFEYAGHTVVIRNEGTITISPETAPDD